MAQSRRAFLRLTGEAIAAGSAAAGNNTPSSQELADMESVAFTFMNAHAVPGLSVAIAGNGAILYERGFGYADREERVTPAHLFRIASVSKPITSVALFRLMEEKRLTLEDTVFGPGGILGEAFGAPPYGRWV